MKSLRLLLCLFALAGPLAAQTPLSDRQLRQRLDFAIAQATNQRTAAQATIDHLAITRTEVHRRIVADSLAQVVATPPPPPPPPVDTVVTQPPPPPQSSSSFLNRNRPAGLTTRIEDRFNRALSAGSSTSTIQSWLQAGGWSDAGIWRASNIKTVVDASGPNGSAGKLNLWTTAPAGSSPGGALSLVESLGSARSQVYVYISFKFESGYSHATNSEKFIYFDNSPQNIIFEYFDGAQAFYNIDDPANRYPNDSGGFLRANLRPMGQHFPTAPPPAAGVWQQLEIVMDANANTVQWWVDGVLWGSHTNVTDFDPIREVMLDDTWGGSGTKPNATAGRVIEYFLVATN